LYRTGPLAAAIVIVLALASCGGGSGSGAATDGGGGETKTANETEGTQAGGAGADGTTTDDTAKSATAKPDANAKPDAACQAQLGEFLGRMTDLRQSLLAGLSYAEYVVRVRAIRDAYEAVPVKKLAVGCLDGAAGAAEDAFNQYLRAANTWGDCAGTAGCAASEIEGKLQRRWRIASRNLDEAKRSS
jgi:hypothetical protein